MYTLENTRYYSKPMDVVNGYVDRADGARYFVARIARRPYAGVPPNLGYRETTGMSVPRLWRQD